MHRLMQPIAAIALGTACLLSTPAAHAQSEPQSPAQQPPSPNISDQKLDEAAAALQHVVVVHQTYQKQIATAPPSERQRLAADANQAIKKAVTDQGLSVSEYNSILDLAQNDPGVRAKLIDRIKGTDGSRP